MLIPTLNDTMCKMVLNQPFKFEISKNEKKNNDFSNVIRKAQEFIYFYFFGHVIGTNKLNYV